MTSATPARPAVAWRWSDALLGAVYALPAAVVMTTDVSKGLACAVGVIPAAVVGLAPERRRRILVFVVGIMAGLSIFVGAALSGQPWLAVPALFALSIGAAELAERSPVGQLALALALPLVAVGLSYSDLQTAGGLALIMVAGSAYAWLVSLLWPAHAAPPAAPRPPSPPMLGYGIRLGLTAATTATIGFALDLEHVGWACAAALLVMRPSREMQEVRSLGRLASVFLGAGAAVVLTHFTSASGWYVVAVIAVVAAASATHTSRWYVTSAFTTFLVIAMLVYSNPDQAETRFAERLLETIGGVAVAYVFGLLVPTLWERWRPSPVSDPPGRQGAHG